MATEEQIKVLLRAAISPLDKKMDHLTTEFAELKRSVEFLSKKYDEVISQLQVANNRISQQSTTIKNVQEELNNVKKQAIDASYQAEELAQYIRRDCLEISGVPPSESYSSNDIVRSVGKLIGIQVSDGDISTAHPVPTFKTDALPKIVIKFVRIDVRNRFYANRRKLVKKKACNLPDLDLDLNNNVYISESLTSTRKKLFGEINKEKKRLKWKHIWTQNGRIFIKEADRGRSFSFNSFEVRTNTGKQTISYMASIFWHNIPPYMKNLNVYQFSKQIKLYLFSEQLENS